MSKSMVDRTRTLGKRAGGKEQFGPRQVLQHRWVYGFSNSSHPNMIEGKLTTTTKKQKDDQWWEGEYFRTIHKQDVGEGKNAGAKLAGEAAEKGNRRK